MRRRSWIGGVLGVVVAGLTAACGGSDEPVATVAGEGGAGSGGTGGVDGACGPLDATLADADAADLFGSATVPTFDLTLPAADWAALQVNARDEIYVQAQACFEGRSIGNVGLRFKGSYGSLYNCFDEAGVNTCRKLGMKLKFDKYDPELRFHGLKRLNFQGYRYDSTYLKERLAYDLYRAMGIVAPRAAWAELRVNGELQGLFGMVEEIDGRFTDDRWPDNGDNNLYKEAWPTTSDATWLTEHLKTNEDAADVANFAAFADAVVGADAMVGADAAADAAALRETFGAYADLDYWARYMAVDDAIANYDGITTYYSSGDASWAGNHNFYIYEEAADDFALIPWDLESTMLPNTGFGSIPHWTVTPADCTTVYPVWGGQNVAVAPGCDPVFRALAADLTGYQAAGQELLDGAFAEATVLAAIDEHASFIRDLAIADPHGPGETAFENDLTYLRTQLPLLRARFEHLLAGETWTSLEFKVGAVNGFEAADDFGLQMGPMLMSNANTTVSVAVNTTTPMAGSQDLLLTFEYANEEEPWQQWTSYLVPMRAAPVDLTAYTGIRMWVRADQPRTLRFDLDSPSETASMLGIRNGWDVAVTAEATRVEVLLDDARVPSWAVSQGTDPGDDPALIRATVSGLAFHPLCAGRADATGQLPEGTTDPGFLAVDDIEFF